MKIKTSLQCPPFPGNFSSISPQSRDLKSSNFPAILRLQGKTLSFQLSPTVCCNKTQIIEGFILWRICTIHQIFPQTISNVNRADIKHSCESWTIFALRTRRSTASEPILVCPILDMFGKFILNGKLFWYQVYGMFPFVLLGIDFLHEFIVHEKCCFLISGNVENSDVDQK